MNLVVKPAECALSSLLALPRLSKFLERNGYIFCLTLALILIFCNGSCVEVLSCLSSGELDVAVKTLGAGVVSVRDTLFLAAVRDFA